MTSQTRPAPIRPRPQGSAPWTTKWARDVVCEVLTDLPCRLAHSLTTGEQAAWVARGLPAEDADVLVIAAYLHDVGYAPALRRTDFHPLDGATFLLELGAPVRVACLVAHHSEAWLVADAHGLQAEMARFPNERSAVTDALTYADMTAGPCGALMRVADRLADIEQRHGDEPSHLRRARRAREPYLRASVDRVRRRQPIG